MMWGGHHLALGFNLVPCHDPNALGSTIMLLRTMEMTLINANVSFTVKVNRSQTEPPP